MPHRTKLRSVLAKSAAGPFLRRVKHRLTPRSTARRIDAQLKASMRLNAKYDEWTREVIRRVVSPDSNCVDVGAYEGGLLRDMVAAAPHGRHIAVEPLPELAAVLRADFPGVEVLEVALSDHDGRDEFFHVVTAAGYSGLRLRRLDRPDERVERIEVLVRQLDDLVPATRAIRFIKIDVEGGELDVLRGGLATLVRNQPYVAFEHGPGSATPYGSSPSELFDLLVGDIGLSISLLDDWLSGGPALSREQFIGEKNFFFLAHPKR